MADLNRQGDTKTFVDEAVDELLERLRQGAGVQRERSLFRWEDSAEETEGFGGGEPDLRGVLVSYSEGLLAAAFQGVSAGNLLCDNGLTVVDCEFVLRPNAAPYYRCKGHTPPDCYDANHRTIGCP